MMNIIVPILGAAALSFVVAGALCLLADARAEKSRDKRARAPDEQPATPPN
jgi:hypothetical protein